MLNSFQSHITETLPWLAKKKLLVACSGGLDSVVLVHLLKHYNYDIALAHCNFSLRALESDEDERFVKELAAKHAVDVYTKTFDTKTFAKDTKQSTQMAARSLRYQWFSELLSQHDFDVIITGHHADDDLETFLINLSRGTGLKGLTGITVANKTIARPFLPFSRAQILTFAKDEKLYWREDSSNASTHYLRNKIRHDVIPSYKEASKHLLKSFQKTQRHLNDSKALIDDYLAIVYNLIVSETNDGYEIDILKLKDLPNTRSLLFELLQPFGFTAWDDIIDLLDAQSGKQLFSGTHRLIKDRGVLVLEEYDQNNPISDSDNSSEEKKIGKSETQIDMPISLSFIPTDKMGYADNKVVYVDCDKLIYPLVVRRWKKGDVFQPFGMKGKKKLSKFFKDEKLSLAAKDKVWLLCDSQRIIWIVGLRSDDYFKITESTNQILKITTTYIL